MTPGPLEGRILEDKILQKIAEETFAQFAGTPSVIQFSLQVQREATAIHSVRCTNYSTDTSRRWSGTDRPGGF